MGRGDNRRSPKMRRRKSWRRLKMRIRKKITAGVGGGSGVAKAKTAVKKPAAAKPAATVTRRPTAAE